MLCSSIKFFWSFPKETRHTGLVIFAPRVRNEKKRFLAQWGRYKSEHHYDAGVAATLLTRHFQILLLRQRGTSFVISNCACDNHVL